MRTTLCRLVPRTACSRPCVGSLFSLIAHGLVSVARFPSTLTPLCRLFTGQRAHDAARSRPRVGCLCPQHAHDPRRSHAHLGVFQRKSKAGCVFTALCRWHALASQGMDWGAPAHTSQKIPPRCICCVRRSRRCAECTRISEQRLSFPLPRPCAGRPLSSSDKCLFACG